MRRTIRKSVPGKYGFINAEATNTFWYCHVIDRLCGLEVRVSGFGLNGPVFDSRHYQIFLVSVGLERGLLSLVSINEELLERKSSGSGLEN
jgi:hypothetical protein